MATPNGTYPPSEWPIDASLVDDLVRQQHPRFHGPEPVPVGEGWDNATFRLGEVAVRVPRRELAVALLKNEQTWLPSIAERLPVRVPSPLAVGVPSASFAWPWSVVPWIAGETADRQPLASDQAARLAEILRRLHRPPPDDAPRNEFRSTPLVQRRSVVEERIARLGLNALAPVWNEALAAGPAGEVRWIHGDVHPRNVVAKDGKIRGIIDWGDVCAGDVATDLACAWMLFGAAADRRDFLEAYGASDDTAARARGWAVSFATSVVESGVESHVAIGRNALRALIADAG